MLYEQNTIIKLLKFDIAGIYSQKIFENLNHTTLTKIFYSDYKDENGDLYLKDTREHTCLITNYKKLV